VAEPASSPTEPPTEPPPALTFTWNTRVMTGFELERERPPATIGGDSQTDYGFFLDQARLELEVEYDKLQAEVSFDLGDAIRPATSTGSFDDPPYLRDAFLNLRVKKYFRVRAGRFKRPYSRLELTSSGVLPFRGRGLLNGLIVEDAQWGGRALGLMLWGKAPGRINWYAGASNPEWKPDGDEEANGLDALARVEWEQSDNFVVGINGGHKLAVRTGLPDTNTNAGGADVLVQLDKLNVMLDALLAELPNAGMQGHTALAYGAVLFASYDVPLTSRLALQPILLGEYADADGDFSGTEAVRAIIGLNLLWDQYLTVMPQVELVRPLGTPSAQNPWVSSESYYVMLRAQL
jgi:hypothetical protein